MELDSPQIQCPVHPGVGFHSRVFWDVQLSCLRGVIITIKYFRVIFKFLPRGRPDVTEPNSGDGYGNTEFASYIFFSAVSFLFGVSLRGVMPAADLKIFYLYVSKYLLFVTIKRPYEGRTDTVQDKYKNINKLKIYRNVFLFSEIYTENLLAIM